MPERVFLVGMMGAGKTTVGRLVAARLGWRYLDSDDQVREATGLGVSELLAQRGRQALHAEEAAALRVAATSPDPVVAAVAGGAVLEDENQRILRDSGTV